jgi:hypothetical protein
MKCLHCGAETGFTATVCPNCGAKPHGGAQASEGLVKILGTILAIFILGKLFGLF